MKKVRVFFVLAVILFAALVGFLTMSARAEIEKPAALVLATPADVSVTYPPPVCTVVSNEVNGIIAIHEYMGSGYAIRDIETGALLGNCSMPGGWGISGFYAVEGSNKMIIITGIGAYEWEPYTGKMVLIFMKDIYSDVRAVSANNRVYSFALYHQQSGTGQAVARLTSNLAVNARSIVWNEGEGGIPVWGAAPRGVFADEKSGQVRLFSSLADALYIVTASGTEVRTDIKVTSLTGLFYNDNSPFQADSLGTTSPDGKFVTLDPDTLAVHEKSLDAWSAPIVSKAPLYVGVGFAGISACSGAPTLSCLWNFTALGGSTGQPMPSLNTSTAIYLQNVSNSSLYIYYAFYGEWVIYNAETGTWGQIHDNSELTYFAAGMLFLPENQNNVYLPFVVK